MDLSNIYLLEIPFVELSLFLFHPKLGPGFLKGDKFSQEIFPLGDLRGGGGGAIQKQYISSYMW